MPLDVTDQVVVAWVNQYLRPLCQTVRDLNAIEPSMVARWGEIADTFVDGATPTAAVVERVGVPVLSAAEVVAAVQLLQSLASTLRGSTGAVALVEKISPQAIRTDSRIPAEV